MMNEGLDAGGAAVDVGNESASQFSREYSRLASMEFIWGELQKARMLRRCCCPTAVPIWPGDVPMTADGLRGNAFVPYGRLARSIAFFSAPGMDRL